MLGVAFELRRTAVIGLGQQRNRGAARRHGRRIIFRDAVHVAFRHLGKRNDLFHRATATSQAKTRQEERRAHELDERTARDRVAQLACAGGKLALDPLPELRLVGGAIEVFDPGEVFHTSQ